MAAVWLDEARCTGCGACVEVCPTGALTLVEGKAHLDDTLCRACEACIQACPAGALQPVLEIEAVPTETHVLEYTPPSVPASRPTGLLATVVAAGVQLAVQAAPLVLQAVGQWLLHPRGTSSGLGRALTSTSRLLGSGRQTRHRQRGRW
jgi:NAD-dependent dihydropyrimidine dehydrogenase PreA subunit